MNDDSTYLPNFIGIGPGKCGTSWLYKACSQHPQVCVSSAKETLFFEDYYHKGIDWYSRFFKHCKNTDGVRAIGEVSNTYIFSPEAAKRIAQHLPNVKLIYNLRDPIDRAFSHYLFLRRNGSLTCSFEEAVQARPDLLSRGLYARHLTPYFELFPADQRLCLIYDDLKSDPDAYANTVFTFLQVDPKLYQGVASERVLGSSAPRSVLLSKIVVAAAAVTRKLGYADIVSKVKGTRINKFLFRPFAPGEAPVLSSETRERLQGHFLDDLSRLESMIGRDVAKRWGYTL